MVTGEVNMIELVITELEATNCFSINFQVNIMSLFFFAIYTVVYITP